MSKALPFRHRASLLGLAILLFAITASAQSPKMARGIDPKNMDPSVKPCDDFYRYANGGWIASNPIPPEYSSWGSFTELAELNNLVLKEILEDAAKNTSAPRGSIAQKIGDFYATGMDSARIEALGAKPIESDLKRILALRTQADLESEIARMHSSGTRPLFGFFSAQDLKNSEMVIGQITQGGLGLPDRDYYVAEDDQSKTIRDEYVNHIGKMFRLIGESETAAAAAAKTVLAVETRLAKASLTRVERRDPDKNYHKMAQMELKSLTPNFDWNRYFVGVGLSNPGDLNVAQPVFFKEVNAMMKEVGMENWKTYLRWHLLRDAASELSSLFVAENFHFYGTTLTGAKEIQPRWKRIRGSVNSLLGEALGELYVAKNFPPDAKARAMAMVKNLLAAMREHITELTWMDDATKKEALKKLSTFGVKIGYPDEWRDYSTLEIDRTSYFENVKTAGAFAVQFNLNKIGKPVDRKEWGMTPPTVNAYYSPTRNEIVFPAGILQPPFFDPEADDAVNYGGMGSVIGHEVSHGFDDQGSKFDAEGNLKDWWTPESRKNFEGRAAGVVKQFDGYVAIDTLHVNGKLTLGENIGDLGGLSIAYTALQKALEGKPRTNIDGFTPEQRFFLAWAQIWRRNARPEALRLQVRTDPHAAAQFRTNGPLSNMVEFKDAFGCPDGSAMVRPADVQAKIW